MSVVAAAALKDRVLVTSDCRLTAIYPGGREVHYDHTLKLIPCGPLTVLGFVGNDVRAAAAIVRELVRQSRRHRRFKRQKPGHSHVPWHPNALHRWIPRYLRWAYARTGSRLPLEFLVASAIPDVPSVVSRSHVAKLLPSVAKRGWGPGWMMDVMMADKEWVALRGTFAPRILVMGSPDFRPTVLGPLSFAAVGSGARVSTQGVAEHTAGLFASEPGLEELHLEIAVAGECARAGISTVGGLRPTYEISSRGLAPRPVNVTKRIGTANEEKVQLIFAGRGRWLQRNTTTGVEIEILPPWQALKDLPPEGRVFGSDTFDWPERS